MKSFIKTFLILVIIGTFSYVGYVFWAGPCRGPIEYKLGEFDTRFNLTEVTFFNAVKEAEDAWEKAVGIDLFKYDPNGSLPINLIYDERQETLLKNKTLESKVDQTELSAKQVRVQFETLKSNHESSANDYDAMILSYKELETAYNTSVEYWNTKGGAPKNEFSQLENQRRELQNMLKLLEQRRIEVNSLAADINTLVSKYNYLVNVANADIEVINESADKEFEQGEYVSSRNRGLINIYEFSDLAELKRVLAHEFGHALGIGHNNNPDSIMYYLNEGTGLVPSEEDLGELKKVCKIK